MLLGPLCALLVGLVSGSCSVLGHYSGVETSIQYPTDDDDSFPLGGVLGLQTNYFVQPWSSVYCVKEVMYRFPHKLDNWNTQF